MNEIIKENKNIEDMIYEVRGVQVMLDSDLAKLYQCTNGTKDINKAVKRNINKFPEDFYFQLTNIEKENLWFQSGTTNNKSRTNPYVFTEQGVAILSSILHTEVAIKTSVKIMRGFIKMRKYFVSSMSNNEIILNHEKRIIELENVFDKFKHHEEVSKIFFEGELYDAYSLLLDILNSSKEEIIIIDNYIGKELLDILKEINKKIIIISKNIDKTLKDKYESQYDNITFIYNTSFYDRFIILDKNKLYACGASFKDLGKKCFAITKFNDKEYLNKIILF